jgi:hypothetical protein
MTSRVLVVAGAIALLFKAVDRHDAPENKPLACPGPGPS